MRAFSSTASDSPYFGRGGAVRLDGESFAAADQEFRDLAAKDKDRDDEEEVRFVELAALLHRD